MARRPIVVRPGNALMSVSFDVDIGSIRKEMPDWAERRIPSITRNALNDTVEDARFAEQEKIRGIFDRPTPLTQRAPLFRRATKENLTAWVFIRDEATKGTAPSKYLQPQVAGGPRGAKRFEKALRAIGVLGPSEFAVPAAGYPRDAYGNLPGSLLVRILSQLRAFTEVGHAANETGTSRRRNRKRVQSRYFVPSSTGRQERGIGRLPRGVYERTGNRIRAVLIFVEGAPHYRKRYDFGQAAKAKAERVFWPYWQRYFYAELRKHTGQRR
jgi:hypothetical protein